MVSSRLLIVVEITFRRENSPYVDRVAGQQQDWDDTEISDGFNGVHRHTRQRAGVDIAVMHRVHMFVDAQLMKEEEYCVKAKALLTVD